MAGLVCRSRMRYINDWSVIYIWIMAAASKTKTRTDPAKSGPIRRRAPSGTVGRDGVAKARWRRRKDARPLEILDAALSVFAEKGFAAARMETIASRAKVSKGTIYLYFASKEAVFKALVKEMLASQFVRVADAARDHQESVADFLADILRMLGHFIATSDRVVLPKIVIAEAGNFPDLARIYREEVVEQGMMLFGTLLQKGMGNGEFRVLPIQHAVRLCIAPLLLAAIWRTTFAPLDAVPYDYAGLIETHIGVLLRGLSVEETAS
jgi:AcrR family transcriptional regulator